MEALTIELTVTPREAHLIRSMVQHISGKDRVYRDDLYRDAQARTHPERIFLGRFMAMMGFERATWHRSRGAVFKRLP